MSKLGQEIIQALKEVLEFVKTNEFKKMKNKQYLINDITIDLIKINEGFEPNFYYCQAGKKTIGYGHVVEDGENIQEPLSKKQAEDLLEKDINARMKQIMPYIKVELNENQLGAIMSLVFNIGVAAFKKSTLLKKLNKGDLEGAAEEFTKWIYIDKKPSEGLLNRRMREKLFFNS